MLQPAHKYQKEYTVNNKDQSLDALCHEPLPLEGEAVAGGAIIHCCVEGSAISGMLYLPQGNGPHPLVLMLHGLPGSIRNEDLAQGLRRLGFAVCIFSYRGSWGNEGRWSYANCEQDTLSMYRLLLQPENAARYRLDAGRVIFLGHSMGGMMAALCASQVPVNELILIAPADGAIQTARSLSPEDKAKRLERLREICRVLPGVTEHDIYEEMLHNAEYYGLLRLVPILAHKRVLLVTARYDTVLPYEFYHKPLREAFAKANPLALQHCVLDTGHNIHTHRMELLEIVARWLLATAG